MSTMSNLKLYEKQKHTIYEIQKAIGVSKDTLYRYARGKRNVENMPTKMVIDIAYFEKIEVNTLFRAMKDYLKGGKNE
jgi:ACT domain-containing protein|uniref:SOS-response transcriptional repressor n=1 Tax=Siphoviridae sp. ctqwY3 TaxID=2827951 RepID=A0A8S5S6P0_9CAUD|nr:MAG TPA: SOS-response transcriptional repressor [Siphoviridae sp. ctqwY3]